MENKQNINIQSILERPLNLSLKLNSKLNNINSQIELEKEYLAKLKTQRQKTERLHTEYLKLKAQSDKHKQNTKKQMNNLNQLTIKYEEDLAKKNEECENWEKQVKKYRYDMDRITKDKQEQIEKTTIAYESAIQELKHNIENLNENIENKNKAASALKKNYSNKIKQLENQRDKCLEECREFQDKYKQSEQRLKEADRQSENLRKIQQQTLYNLTKCQTELQSKNRQTNTLKLSNNKLQLQGQTSLRKITELQNHLRYLQQQFNTVQKNNDRLEEKYEKCHEELLQTQRIKQRYEKQIQKMNQESNKMKNQLASRDESIREYQSRLMKFGEVEEWRNRCQQLQAKIEELESINKGLKEQNETLMSFWKQKQLVDKERRALMQNQMDQIHKFELLLKDVR